MRTARELEHRAFPAGWWHANDGEGLADVMRGCLADLGLDSAVISDAMVVELVALANDANDAANEELARRHQIGTAARHVNGSLASSERRLYAFDNDLADWETGEPVWLLLTADERAQLLAQAIVRLPSGLEREYDPAREQHER